MTIQFNQVVDGFANGAKVTLEPVREAAYVAASQAAYVPQDAPAGVGPLPVRAPITITNIATVGSGTLTAAGMVGGVINRSGSTAGYADTFDTATNILAALPARDKQIGMSFEFLVINTVAFADTVAAGTGVTLAGTTAIAASTWRRYVCTITALSTPAVTITGIASGPL